MCFLPPCLFCDLIRAIGGSVVIPERVKGGSMSKGEYSSYSAPPPRASRGSNEYGAVPAHIRRIQSQKVVQHPKQMINLLKIAMKTLPNGVSDISFSLDQISQMQEEVCFIWSLCCCIVSSSLFLHIGTLLHCLPCRPRVASRKNSEHASRKKRRAENLLGFERIDRQDHKRGPTHIGGTRSAATPFL